MKVAVQPVTSSDRQRGNGLRVIHPHGYVPKTGPISRKDIVFTEPDYHRLTESVFHWALADIVDRLRKNTVLFIGLSMSDPSLRRLLDASRNSDIPPHWQIQKRHEIRDHEILQVMAEVERRGSRLCRSPWIRSRRREAASSVRRIDSCSTPTGRHI